VIAAGLTRRWARLYVRGLPEHVRRDRLAELESDLWEHVRAAGGGSGPSILSRCLRGVPADLAWRRAQRRPRRLRLPETATVLRTLGWAAAACSYVLLVTAHGAAATPLVGLGFVHGETADVEHVARASALLFALLVGGGALIRPRPREGALLVAAGGLATPIAYSWAAALFLPLGAVAAAGGIALALRARPAG
jgi:hypothetical protein